MKDSLFQFEETRKRPRIAFHVFAFISGETKPLSLLRNILGSSFHIWKSNLCKRKHMHWSAVTMAVGRVLTPSVILLSLSLLSLYSVDSDSPKHFGNAQRALGTFFSRFLTSHSKNLNQNCWRTWHKPAAILFLGIVRNFWSQEWRILWTVQPLSTRRTLS